jgi:hypothetical protein
MHDGSEGELYDLVDDQLQRVNRFATRHWTAFARHWRNAYAHTGTDRASGPCRAR